MIDVCAGIVLFNPEIKRLEENLRAISNQVDEVLMVDNSSSNISEILLLVQRLGREHIKLYRFQENRGIACALNELCRSAAEKGYHWIVTLDQDSVCPYNLVKRFAKYVSREDIAIICPSIKDRNLIKGELKTEGIEEVDHCITSGSMLSIEKWKAIGGFDESMFIDGVDFDICNRLKKKGNVILKVNDVVILHELGNSELRKFLFWNVVVKNHSAFRKFYIARNTIYLARKNGMSNAKAFLQILKQILICILYEEDKAEKCKRIIDGALEGMRCKVNLR